MANDTFKLIKDKFPKKMVYKSKTSKFIIKNIRLLPLDESGNIRVAYDISGEKEMARQFMQDNLESIIEKLNRIRPL